MIAHLRQSSWRSWLPERLIELGFCLAFLIFSRWQFPPASLLLLAGAAGLAWIRLEIAIALLPLTFPYWLNLIPLRSSPTPAFSIGELGILICLGAALLRSVFIPAERQATRDWLRGLWGQARLFLLPAALLLLGATLGLLASPDRHEGLRYYRWDILEPLLYFLLVQRYLRTRKDLARTIAALILSGLIVSGAVIVQGLLYLSDHPSLITSDTTSFRPLGPYGSANNVGLLLDRIIPLALALGLTHVLRRSTASAPAERPFWRDPLRWVCALALIPLAWALYWSRSRGAEVALLAVVVFFFIVEVRRWLAIAAVLIVGGAGTALFWPRLLDFLNSGHNGTATVSERFVYWKAALLIIRDHFFLGTGPDSYGKLYNPDAPLRPQSPDSYALKALNGQPFPSSYDPSISHPHNIFFEFWISSGLLGLAALLWLLGTVATTLLRLYRRCASLHQSNLLQRLLLGIAGSMLASLVHGLVDNSYFLPDLAADFWLLIGSLLVLSSIAQREQAAPQKEKLPQPVDTPLPAG